MSEEEEEEEKLFFLHTLVSGRGADVRNTREISAAYWSVGMRSDVITPDITARTRDRNSRQLICEWRIFT